MNFSQLFHVAWFTFFQAACSTILALAIGIPGAFFCGRRNFIGRKFLLSLSVIPFCVPSLIIALGYVIFLGMNGGLNHFLMFIFGLKEPPLKILYSFCGLIIAHGFYNFPLIMKNVADSWERIPSIQAESARLLGAKEGRIFRTVTIYQLLPSIASSSLLVFIYCFLSFILVLLFGGVGNSTLEVEIYKASRATLDFSLAGKLALLETSILCLVTTAYGFLEQRSQRSKGVNQRFYLQKIKGIKEWIPFVFVIFLIILFFIMPLFGILSNAFTTAKDSSKFSFETFKRVLKMKSFLPSLKNTITTATATGFFSMLIGFLYSVFLRFAERKSSTGTKIIFKIIPMIPMSVSSVVVGVIITMLIRKGNVGWLIFAQTSLSWPLAFRIIYPHLSKISDNTLDCATMLSKNKIDLILRTILPICKKVLISSFGFCFAVSAGDTTLPLVLAIPKYDSLSLFTYRFAGAYRFNEACAAGVILGLLCALVFIISGYSKNKKGL